MSDNLTAEETLLKALKNAENDRTLSASMIEDLWIKIASGSFNYQSTGHLLGKYMDNLQRSNEQIIKIGNTLTKTQSSDEEKELDIDEVYGELEETKQGGE